MVAYADGALSRGTGGSAGRGRRNRHPGRARRRDPGLVKDYMLAQLARLPDAGSVAVVARELG
jgi:hypothetical protein